jgi:hypothetical protein
MMQPKTFGALFFFVGITLVAYGCDDTAGTAPPPAPDASLAEEGGTSSADAEAGACKSAQVPADYEKCFTFASQAFPAAQPVTTACLPAELAGERPKTFAFGDLAWGDFVLSEAYDLSSNCAQAKTLVETLKYNDIYITVATSYTARPDGAIGRSTTQYVRLPPQPADPDAGTSDPDPDAGDGGKTNAPEPPPPSPEAISLPQRSCPPALPEVSCVPIDSWFQAGFHTSTATELRLYKNPAGAAPDPSTAQLYAVYKRVK